MLETFFLTQVNFQYIKSYEDPLNRLELRAKTKSQFGRVATNLCCGWEKQQICADPRGPTQTLLYLSVTFVASSSDSLMSASHQASARQ